jgi:hypothetical protein
MKRSMVVVLMMAFLLCLGGGWAEAQFFFGTKGGLGISNHWSTEEKGNGYTVESGVKLGGSIGVLGSYQISRYFAVQGEVLYTQKGSKQDVTLPPLPPPLGDIGAIELTYQMDYVEIPLILKTYPFQLETFRPYTTIGPYVAFLTGNEYEMNNETLEGFVPPGGDDIGAAQEIEDLKETDYGIVFGTGLEYHLYDLRFSLDYRYTMGFVDLTLPTGEMPEIPGMPPEAFSDAFPEIELRNNCHMFLVGILY